MATALKFNKMAAQMARRGCPIIPVRAKDKVPLPYQWPLHASTNPGTILGWITQYGNDINCGCVATPDGYWYLDCDNPNLMALIEQETGQRVPLTFRTASRKGFHYYWRQTDASRAMGNRAAHVAPYEFDAQVERRQVIAPGSTHPSGFVYHIVDDVPIVAAPDWLVDWVSQHSTHEKVRVATPGKRDLKVDDDFDFEAFCEHYEIETMDDDGSGWHVTPTCPYSGTQHEQSTRTGFFYDGEHFGFHCFAGGCGDPSIGELIRKLNEESQWQPYDGVIWPGFNQTDKEMLLDPKWNITLDDVDVEEPTPLVIEQVVVPSQPLVTVTGDDEVAELAELIAEKKASGAMPLSPEDYLPEPLEVAIVDPDNRSGSEFPGAAAMYGKLAQMTELHSRLPAGWLYVALLVTASALPIEDRDHYVRSNEYAVLVGDVGTGKSVCLDVAKHSIFLPGEDTVVEDAPGSHSGLMKQLNEDMPLPKLLLIDEFRMVMNACAIQGSSLPPMLCTFWNKDKAGGAVKAGRQIAYAKLSILGGLACKDSAEFGRLFGSHTVAGLADRFLLGYAPGYIKARPEKNIKKEVIEVKPVTIPEWVWDAKDKWIGEEDARRRLSEHVLRVALITAACNGDREITQPCLEAAFRFGEWQQRLRKTFAPGVAETKDAEALEAIWSALREQFLYQQKEKAIPKGATEVVCDIAPEERWRFVHFTNVINKKSYYRKYGKIISQIRKTLLEEGFISEVKQEEEEDERGKKKGRKSKTPFVMLTRSVR